VFWVRSIVCQSGKRLSIRFCGEESFRSVLLLNRDSYEKIAVIEKVVPSHINTKWISLLPNTEQINSIYVRLLLIFIVTTLMGIIFCILLSWLSGKRHLFRSEKKPFPTENTLPSPVTGNMSYLNLNVMAYVYKISCQIYSIK